jgi:hypothetical protein
MLIKVVKEDGEEMYECVHYAVREVTEESVAARIGTTVGIYLELSGGQTIHLPTDGRVAYVMNDKGDTVDAHRWPPRSQEQQTGRNEDGTAVPIAQG